MTDTDKCVLPKECPEGGDHKWVCQCKKCDMKIFYNPEATIGKQAEQLQVRQKGD